MPTLEPHRLPATEIVRRIEAGTLTAERVVASCLERIADRDPVVRAWCHLERQAALAAAQAYDRKGGDCLLRGLPFGLKDIFDSADMPASYGSPIYAGWRPATDASAAALPRAAGGILLGKTMTTEFASRHPAATTNPVDPDFSPGGSVIRPAAYCGVVGFKPSFGLFPPAGMRANTEALDTVGLMTRSVADVALFRAAMMAIPYTPPVPPERPPRLALCRTPHWDEALPEGRRTLESAAERLAAAGAAVIETALPNGCGNLQTIHRTLARFESPRNLAAELARHAALLSPVMREQIIATGRTISLDDFRTAQAGAERARLAAADWAHEFDAVLTLPAPGQAPRGLAETGPPTFNYLWTLLYMPCITLPAGHGPDGLPVGIQLVARRHRDAALLNVASWVERRLDDAGAAS
ncbi:MAG TPA: amidase [Alphaproteobacteria bacterium]